MRLTRLVSAAMFAAACLLVFSVPAVYAGTISVTSTLDDGTGCTLREAIEEANSVGAGGGTLGNGCSGATVGANTISLPAGDYTLTSGSALSVTSTIEIQSSSSPVNIEANAAPNVSTYRVFTLNSSPNLTLDGVTVRNGGSLASFASFGGCILVNSGQLTLENNTIVEDCNAGANGGGIRSSAGTTVIITNSIVRDNTSTNNGGGIDSNGSLTVTNSGFSGNSLSVVSSSGNGFGGAISSNGALTVTGSTFTNNTSTDPGNGAVGGAIFSSTIGTITISSSTFTSNRATAASNAYGGAIAVQSASTILNISGSVFSGNQVTGSGNGGAVASVSGTINITTSRFESNTAVINGDAIYNNGGENITVSQSCITDNGDTAVTDTNNAGTIDATGGGNVADSNWWGTAWGPRIAVAGGSSQYSNGDSINGNGNTVSGDILVDVNLSSAGDGSSTPTGDWLTSAPANVAGDNCMVCTEVSSIGHARTCVDPTP